MYLYVPTFSNKEDEHIKYNIVFDWTRNIMIDRIKLSVYWTVDPFLKDIKDTENILDEIYIELHAKAYGLHFTVGNILGISSMYRS